MFVSSYHTEDENNIYNNKRKGDAERNICICKIARETWSLQD